MWIARLDEAQAVIRIAGRNIINLRYADDTTLMAESEEELKILLKSWLIGKDSDAGRDWGQEEKEMTEDEMAGWHHRLDGHEFEWTLGVTDRQGGLVCCDSWGS